MTKEELERRRESLLKDDSLAIRCDVGVTEMSVVSVAPKESHNTRRPEEEDDDEDWEGGNGGRRRHQPLDDMEYVRRSLAKNRRAA